MANVKQFPGGEWDRHWWHPLHAERDILEIIRGNDADEFSITVERQSGVFTVRLNALPGQHPDFAASGSGNTLAEAWQNLKPSWVDKIK